jgi:hypothetical protein
MPHPRRKRKSLRISRRLKLPQLATKSEYPNQNTTWWPRKKTRPPASGSARPSNPRIRLRDILEPGRRRLEGRPSHRSSVSGWNTVQRNRGGWGFTIGDPETGIEPLERRGRNRGDVRGKRAASHPRENPRINKSAWRQFRRDFTFFLSFRLFPLP